jgi:hypothetical protein
MSLNSNETQLTDVRPLGYILEAPFNCMKDEVATFKISWMAAALIDVNKLLADAKLEFDSQSNLVGTLEPILILHAEDDADVPYSLG